MAVGAHLQPAAHAELARRRRPPARSARCACCAGPGCPCRCWRRSACCRARPAASSFCMKQRDLAVRVAVELGQRHPGRRHRRCRPGGRRCPSGEPLYVCATPPWLSAGSPSGLPAYDRSFMNSVAKRVMSQAKACASMSMSVLVIASKYGSPPLYCLSFGNVLASGVPGACRRRRCRPSSARRTASRGRAASPGAGPASAARRPPAARQAVDVLAHEVDHALAQARVAASPRPPPPDRSPATKPENSVSNACTGSMIFGSGAPPGPYDSVVPGLRAVVADAERDAGHARGRAQLGSTARY